MTSDNLKDEILKLKQERRAVILAHNYQRDEIQEIADFTGDSLELARNAVGVDCDVIVFCGVNFMAESAAVLSPEKTVLLPAEDAFCPMADMITVDFPRDLRDSFPGYEDTPEYLFPKEFTLREIKSRFPGIPVVTYVNTTADVKAESDVCCTSANVVKVIESLADDEVICAPDRNLSAWAAKNTTKKIISWDGYCHVHDRVRMEDIENARKKHPGALVMAHPECRIDVLELADHVTSTSGMLRFAGEKDEGTEFIVGTEIGLLYRLRKENPGKVFHPLRRDMVCPNMKKTTLNHLYLSLKEMRYVISVPEEIRSGAKKALDKMLAI